MLGEKTKVLVSQIEKIRITLVESELEALLLEAFYIKKYKPRYNIRLTDNKSYLRIRITAKEPYPAIMLARNVDDDSSLYFGPFPSSAAVKLVLKTIRRVFPFVSVYHHPKRICLYHHLGLCPCPPLNDSPQLKKEYRRNIKRIIRILEGGSRSVMKGLEKKRDLFSKKEKFEDALALQKKIQAFSLITTPFHKPFEYHVNPNLRTDLRQQELAESMEVLNKYAYHLQKLERIECYDISNIQGTNATGSMVVLTNGEIDTSQYRRFKIRRDWEQVRVNGRESRLKKESPNDFAMMEEVLKRRFGHDEWHMPDLIIVDGGKGQISAALKAFAKSGINIPLIGLAKREETIVIPKFPISYDKSQTVRDGNKYMDNLKFLEISLSKNSPALHLMMRIRDEAHRFAVSYHRKLRSKRSLSSF